MPERVLANPLSGAEIRKAILDKISVSLGRDCYLSENLAYDYFDCNVKIALKCHDVGQAREVNLDQTVTEGAPPNDNALLNQADAEFNLEPKAPNEVRVETGQEVPVLTKDSEGKPLVKGIKYGRKATSKATANVG